LPAAIAAVIVVLVGAGIGIAAALRPSGGNTPPLTEGSETTPVDGVSTPPTTEPTLPADEQCTDAIMANPHWVCLTQVTLTANELTVSYDTNTQLAFTDGGFHLHIYQASADGSTPSDNQMSANSANQGSWHIASDRPAVLPAQNGGYGDGGAIRPDAVKVCARIADHRHNLIPDASGAGTYKTGNCWPVTRA
jgi:hypothetical protein